MQIRCRCGANLVVAPGTLSVVCASCQATVAVPQPQGDIGLDETVLSMPAAPERAPAPRAPARSAWPIAIGALVIAGAGVALAVYALRGDQPTTPTTHEVARPTIVDAAVAAPATPQTAASPEDLVVLERAAIARADEAALGALLAPDAFGFGIDAGEVTTTGPAVAAMLHAMLGTPGTLTSTSSRIARTGDIAWIVDEFDLGTRHFMTSQLAARTDGVWRIAAWHWATLVPNPLAAELAKAGTLPVPAAIADRPDDDHQVADAFGAAFASRQAFIDAYSGRADAIDIGSAPRELVVSGAAVKTAFTKIPADMQVNGGIAAGRVSDRAGWAAANVDFTQPVGGAPLTQTFRVLAILVREKAGWRIVLAQWSNAGPITPGR